MPRSDTAIELVRLRLDLLADCVEIKDMARPAVKFASARAIGSMLQR